jgi:hypothetical protein
MSTLACSAKHMNQASWPWPAAEPSSGSDLIRNPDVRRRRDGVGSVKKPRAIPAGSRLGSRATQGGNFLDALIGSELLFEAAGSL